MTGDTNRLTIEEVEDDLRFFNQHLDEHNVEPLAEYAQQLLDTMRENERLRRALDPRRWDFNRSNAWHKAIPDLQAAFDAINPCKESETVCNCVQLKKSWGLDEHQSLVCTVVAPIE